MNNHGMEFLAYERMHDRLQEAERARLARLAAKPSRDGRAAHVRRGVTIAHRLARVAAAAWTRGRRGVRVAETEAGG